MDNFRFAPTTAASSGLVHRQRITLALAERFEHRLTLITAPAGSGKTAALALAVENNMLDPAGRDVWLSAIPRDSDPEHAASGLARALEVDNSGGVDAIVDRLHDAVWTQSPDTVAIIIDDAHLFDSDASRSLLQRLISDLPANGHIVLASRTPLDLQIARLRAHGEVLEVSADDLELDADEIEQLVAARARKNGTPASAPHFDDLPRHPATADLTLAAGTSASIDFLWEEILSHLPPDRLADLQRVSVVEILDDDLVGELTDHRCTVDQIVDGLPLTVRIGTTVRLHGLLRDALERRMSTSERRKACALAADVERRRARWAEAVQLFEAADDPLGITETVTGYCRVPLLHRTIEDTVSIVSAINQVQPDSGLALTLTTNLDWMARASGRRSDRALVSDIEASIAFAREADQPDIEANQIHLRLQADTFAGRPIAVHHVERLAELGETNELARLMYAFNESIRRADDGDIDGAKDILSVFDDSDLSVGMQWRSERWVDLGHVEAVMPIDAEGADPTGLMTGYSYWLRGEAPPRAAFDVVAQTINTTLRKGFDLISVSTLGVGIGIAAAAGEHAIAQRWSRQAAGFLGGGLAPSVELFVHLGRAIISASEGDEDAARASLDPALTGCGFDGWPARPMLMAIPLVYLVRPDSRTMFDRSEFGGALSASVAAGQALVAVRERDELAVAGELPWTNPVLLRANVLPIHLIELACAAAYTGVDEARSLAMETPHLSELLRIARERARGELVDAIDALADGLPITAPYTLTTTLLGDPSIYRDGVLIEDERWKRRPRLRELWTYLAVKRRTTRFAIVADLWPDSEVDEEAEKRAMANLRSTLSMLVSILEPDRPNGQDSFFIRLRGDVVELNEAVVTDLDALESVADAALAADAQGLPLESLEHHQRVVELASGPLAETIDAGWLFFDQLRYQAMATASLCRLAELTASRGEPEAAMRWAERALQRDPNNERAGRLLIEALAASGNRSAARAAAVHLATTARAQGLALEPATTRLFARLKAGHL